MACHCLCYAAAMENLEIRDDDGDRFTLSETDEGAMIEMGPEAVAIGQTGAQALVDWLHARFQFGQELAAAAYGAPGLSIDVETETGKNRSVRWYGPDMPAALLELAGLALIPIGPRRVADLARQFQRQADILVQPDGLRATEGLYSNIVAGISLLLHEIDPESAGVPVATRVKQLVNRLKAAETSVGFKGVRDLLLELNADTPEEALRRVREDHSQIDAVATQMLQTLGPRTEAASPRDLRQLFDQLLARHREALANQMSGAQATLNKARADHRAVVQRLTTEHARFRDDVPNMIEKAMGTERNARAAVQVDLDNMRKINAELRRDLNDRETRLRHHREMLEQLEASIGGSQADRQLPIIARVQSLVQANTSAQGVLTEVRTERNHLRGLLNTAREVLIDMRGELSGNDEGTIADASLDGVMTYNNSVIETWHRRIVEAIEQSKPHA